MKTSVMIKTLRKKINASQEELAHMLGVTWRSVSSWEREQAEPSRLSLKKIDKLVQELKQEHGSTPT